MSIFSKISKVFGGSATQALPEADNLLNDLNRDNRVHSRYVLRDDAIAHITLANGLTGVVRDMSYGGMALRFETNGVTPPLAQEVTGQLRVLDREVSTRFCPVRIVSQNTQFLFIGCTLIHDSAETLIFLRDLIEPLRCGRSMTQVPEDMRNDKYRGAEWSCFRGDGPTDLLLRAHPQSKALEEALLTFRVGDTYREVSFKGGRFKTGKSTQGSSESNGYTASSQMANTHDLDKQVLRHAACVIIGMAATDRSRIEPLLHLVLKALDLSARAETAA